VGAAARARRQAIRRSTPERMRPLEDADKLLRSIIEQTDRYSGAPGKSLDEIRQRVAGSLQRLADALADLPFAHSDGGRLLVPDTNALLFKPDLATWQPPDGARTVVLVLQMLRELDALKLRRGAVGEKATSVIRRVKEYARRGDTFEGVPVAGALAARRPQRARTVIARRRAAAARQPRRAASCVGWRPLEKRRTPRPVRPGRPPSALRGNAAAPATRRSTGNAAGMGTYTARGSTPHGHGVRGRDARRPHAAARTAARAIRHFSI